MTRDLSLPIIILRHFPRVGILNAKDSQFPLSSMQQFSWETNPNSLTLKKAKYDQQDKYLALLFLNLQPNENGISPA